MFIVHGCILRTVTILMLLLGTLSVGQPDKPQAMNLATWLKHVATEWDKELCEKSGGCECQGDDHPNFPFGIPEITAADRCQPEHAFDKETCLRALASGLFHMEVFVKYIEQTLVSEQPPTYSWITAKHLANTLKSLMEDPETVTYPDEQVKDSYSQMLASYTDFRTVVIKHLILQGYISLLENIRNLYTYMEA